MSHLIDVHILTLQGRSRKWLAESIASLHDQPVNLHIVPGHPGDISIGRRDGFMCGTAPYVTFVDDDDYVTEGIFEEITPHLKPDTILYTDEVLQIEHTGDFIDGWSINPEPFIHDPRLHQCLVPGTTHKYMHHLVVIPRRFLINAPYERGFAPEPAILRHAYNQGAKFERYPKVGYVWRIHDKQSTWKT